MSTCRRRARHPWNLPRPSGTAGLALATLLTLAVPGCGGSRDDAAADAEPAHDPVDTNVGEWTEAARTASGSRMATQLDTRAGAHESFDRLVMVFADRTPGYEIRYADGPVHQCGSGRPVEVGTPAVLRIRMDPARAHNDRGAATVQQRSLDPGLDVLRTARIICDYEGSVEWVVGTTGRTPFRVFTLDSPARLVVDLQR